MPLIGTTKYDFKVAIAEDDPSIRDLVRVYFDMLGVKSDAYATGDEALEGIRRVYFQGGFYKALLTDHRMPRLNGFDLISIMKEEIPPLPVYMISSREENELKAWRAGASGFFLYPITLTNIEDIVNDITANR